LDKKFSMITKRIQNKMKNILFLKFSWDTRLNIYFEGKNVWNLMFTYSLLPAPPPPVLKQTRINIKLRNSIFLVKWSFQSKYFMVTGIFRNLTFCPILLICCLYIIVIYCAPPPLRLIGHIWCALKKIMILK